jgi:hypothetical protein
VTVDEVDVVGSPWHAPAKPLASGATLAASREVAGYLVDRFALQHAWVLTPAEIGARAGTLLAPAAPAAAVLVQRPA